MDDDANDATIVRSTIDLARNLGLRVVAEGVETKETWDALVVLGCDFAQGYLVGRPQAAEQLTEQLVQAKIPGEPEARGRLYTMPTARTR
jgi:EAL domain-containing protein (putative c-di-GMP-specific phosphodiesterase class I)